MIDKIKIYLQYITPQHLLTRLVGSVANCRWKWVKNLFIKQFIQHFQVDMTQAAIENPADYPDFNCFFTRHLKPELRPIANGANEIACPIDGCISQIGVIDDHLLLQAKGFNFDLTQLLGGSSERAQLFKNGHFATFYLSPRDYHRVHMPLTGALYETIYIPGKLFSVNHNTTQHVPALFARNERLVCLFETEIGPMAIILVGAMIVGSINTAWGETRHQTIVKRTFHHPTYNRGDEMGYFKLGSTVIILFPQNKMSWLLHLTTNQFVQMGQNIGITKKTTIHS